MNKKRIGFVGCPPENILNQFSSDELVDLDNRYSSIPGRSSELLPANTCAIVKRIVDNALALDLEAIIFDEGYGKCDAARAAGEIIRHNLKIPIIRTRNDNKTPKGTPISDSDLPLKEKAILILDNLSGIPIPSTVKITPAFNPPAAIWGVPASDMSIYDLFPDGTKILGWFRCLENRTPADEELELYVDPKIPTVFFAQTFCYKNILAKHLAKKYNGLYIDVDGSMTRSDRAKVETFLKFRLGK